MLKDLVTRVPQAGENGEGATAPEKNLRGSAEHAENARHQLSCIITAYELLSGQGA